MTEIQKTDIVIIGAGPVGLFAVFECGMLGMSCTVIDSLEAIGGQCAALYPEKPIYDIPAFAKITGGDLIKNLEEQAAAFKPKYVLNQQVTEITGQDNTWQVTTSKNTKIKCRAVIIAAGAGAFGPNRPPLENLDAFEGSSVFYMVGRRDNFKGKKIVIAGGGDSAIDWALSLSEIADVTLIHRRDKFRAAPDSVSQVKKLAKQGKLTLCVPSQLKRLEGDKGVLHHVILDDLNGGEISLEADILLPFYGLAAKLGPIAEWGLDLDGTTIKTNQATSQTNINGIYAIGDIATYDQKLKLILTGFGEAAQAAHHIWHKLNPDQALHMEYSTTKGVPNSS